jgi:Leucine-rich repeat (LRR) protein
MGLKVFKKIKNLHEARDTTRVHVEALKKSNLLLDGPNSESVKMHDLVRDFGILIASEDKFMVRFDTGLMQWPMGVAQEQCTHISMHCGELSELPTGLNYPSLKLLHLISGIDLFRFPKGLDEVCGGVRVLDLQCFELQSLQPIECLRNLISLSLSKCTLSVQDLSSIGNIKHLEMLSFANSDIRELPGEIGKLTRLRLLDLTGCDELEKVSPGVLLGLTFLEELYMRGTSIVWAEEYSSKRGAIGSRVHKLQDKHWGKDFDNDDEVLTKKYASFADLEQLCNLVVIEIHVPYQFVPVKVKLEKLEKFMITVGGDEEYKERKEWEDDPMPTFQNYLSLNGGEIKFHKEILKALCKKTECLYLSVQDLVNLRNEVDENDLTRLSTLICANCDNLASVFDQSFKISSSPTLLPPFRNLRVLEFLRCGKLKNVFAPSIARSFINLECVKIDDCSSIEEIICAESSGDQDEQKPFEFLKLKTLDLIYLPNFVCFSKAGDHEVHLPQLQFVHLEKLPKLSSIDPVMKAVSNLGHQHQQIFQLEQSQNPLL